MLYNTSKEDARILGLWPETNPRPALVLTIPSIRDVGEEDLIGELASRSYSESGFHDSPHRHFMSRNYPYGGSNEDYSRFVDDPVHVAEITSGFTGVDCIDLTSWLGEDLGLPAWERFLGHIRSWTDSSFLFKAYTDLPVKVDPLVKSIVSGCGIAVYRVDMAIPKPEQLLGEFNRMTSNRFVDSSGRVLAKISELIGMGRGVNYGFIDAIATMASYELEASSYDVYALDHLFDRRLKDAPFVGCSRTLGF